MIRPLPVLLSALLAAHAWAAPAASPARDCAASPAPPGLGAGLVVEGCRAFGDADGDHVLYLAGSHDIGKPDERLSRTVEARMYRGRPGGPLAPQWTLHDHALPDEAGIRFDTARLEFARLTDDGLVMPVLVYRIAAYASDSPRFPDPGPLGDVGDVDPYAGRLKLVAFHGDAKIALRAVTGDLDEDRSTTASASFFELPKAARAHLVRILERIRRDGDFTFASADGTEITLRREK